MLLHPFTKVKIPIDQSQKVSFENSEERTLVSDSMSLAQKWSKIAAQKSLLWTVSRPLIGSLAQHFTHSIEVQRLTGCGCSTIERPRLQLFSQIIAYT